MKGKRDLAAKLLSGAGIPTLALRVGPRSTLLRVLVYHRVRQVDQTFRFDPELVSATCEEFSWQMRYLQNHATPISFRELAAIVDGELPCPPNPAIVTFDDGFDDNFLNAYPILRALGVKATMFVVTDYVGSRRAFWFDQVTHVLSVAQAGSYDVPQPGRAPVELVVPVGLDERRALARRMKAGLKSGSNDELVECVDALSRTLGVPAAVDDPDSRPFGWEELAEMASSGLIEFGSHSKTHCILSQVNRANLIEELQVSRDRVRRATGEACTVIAYPSGGRDSYSDAVIGAIRDAGYRFACTNMAGANRLNGLRPFELRRSPVERHTTRGRFRAALAFPGHF